MRDEVKCINTSICGDYLEKSQNKSCILDVFYLSNFIGFLLNVEIYELTNKFHRIENKYFDSTWGALAIGVQKIEHNFLQSTVDLLCRFKFVSQHIIICLHIIISQ